MSPCVCLYWGHSYRPSLNERLPWDGRVWLPNWAPMKWAMHKQKWSSSSIFYTATTPIDLELISFHWTPNSGCCCYCGHAHSISHWSLGGFGRTGKNAGGWETFTEGRVGGRRRRRWERRRMTIIRPEFPGECRRCIHRVKVIANWCFLLWD